MALTTCRECGREVSDEARSCPHCGAPRPGNHAWKGWGWEWASAAKVGRLPLVHIAVGRDPRNKRRVARGVIAIGQYAVGVVPIAQFGVGVVGLTQFGVGIGLVAQFGIAYAALAQIGVAVHLVAQLGVALVDGRGQYILHLGRMLGW